jgi:hypothetical protein
MWVVQMAIQDFFTQRQRAVEPVKPLRQRCYHGGTRELARIKQDMIGDKKGTLIEAICNK